MTTTTGDEKVIREEKRYKYVEVDGKTYLVVRKDGGKGDWGKRRISAEPKGNRLPDALRRQITLYYDTPGRNKGVAPPPGWRYEYNTGRIVRYNPDKIVMKNLTQRKAKELGFSYKKDLINFMAVQAETGNPITTFSKLKKTKEKKTVARRLSKDTATKLRAVLEKQSKQQSDTRRIRVVQRRVNGNLRLVNNVYSLDMERLVDKNDVPHIEDIITYMVGATIKNENLQSNDKIQIRFESESFTKARGSIFTGFVRVQNYKSAVADGIERIARALNSAEQVEDLRIIINGVDNVKGSGYSNNCIKYLENKGIYHNDETARCGPISLIVCKPFVSAMNTPKDTLKKSRTKARVKAGKRLMEVCGIDPDQEVFDLDDFEIVSQKFNICIHIFDLQGKVWHNTSNKLSVPNDDDHHAYVLKNYNHYEAIHQPKHWFGRNNICHTCEKGYNNDHKCKSEGPAPARQYQRSNTDHCPFCIKKRDDHYHRCCRNCLEDVSKEGHKHKCYMTKGRVKAIHPQSSLGCELTSAGDDAAEKLLEMEGAVLKKIREDGVFIAEYHNLRSSDKYAIFDLEAMTLEDNTQVPNKASTYYFDGTYFEHNNIDDFMNWVLKKEVVDGKERFIHSGYTFVAHYGSGYDFMPVWKWLFQHTNIYPFTIHNGNKINMMSLKKVGIKFIDSYKHFLQPLEALPEMFGIKEMKKGFFPHKFNTPENQSYVGPVPDKKYYSPNTMKSKKREEFLEWYAKQEGKTFDLQKEMSEYCQSDAKILLEACKALRSMFLEKEGLDPFQYTTLPATTMTLFRANHMPEGSIAVFNNSNDNQSKVALEWLLYVEVVKDCHIHKATDGREAWAIIKRDGEEKYKKVDGLCEKEVYEFSGCYHHGCEKCFPERKELYQKTTRQIDELRQAGYTVHHIWECEWEAMKDCGENVSAILKKVGNELPINPRDAFFGGRTDALKTFFDIRYKPGVKIYYKDITSLYPFVNFTKAYPCGHPEVIRDNFDYSLRSYFGLVKCRVQPPNNLYHPVLPRRIGNKLVFDLGGESNEAFTGVWTSMELVKAVEKGYKIEKIYEVIHFNEQSTSIFKTYVGEFLQIKQEASGYPSWVKTEEDKDKYVDEYYTKMGIKLNKDKIAKNKGLRSFAKLCLNNLWGRFGMRTFNDEKKFVRTNGDLVKILSDPKIQQDTVDLMLFDDSETAIASYNLVSERVENRWDTNVFIAVFTASWARLELYKALEVLGERVLYMDTDSVIYYHESETDHGLSEGDYLGEFTDELDGHYVDQWASGGPKNYGYSVPVNPNCTKKDCDKCGSTECKVKGFSLTHGNKKNINFNSVKSAVESACRFGQMVNLKSENFAIRYQKKSMDMKAKTEPKEWSFCLEKRQISSISAYCIDTLPFGHCKLEN